MSPRSRMRADSRGLHCLRPRCKLAPDEGGKLIGGVADGIRSLLRELIAQAKARPGQLNYANSGVGANAHLAAELFKSMTGTQMTHVSYRGSVPALNDVIAGHIDFMFVDFASAAGQIQGGKVRPLAVSTKARIPAFPDIPPVADSVPGYDVAAWFMVVAPSKTPPAGGGKPLSRSN